MRFGEFFKNVRQERDLSIRQFCLKFGYDTGNISKIERGVLMPPQSEQKLNDYAKALGLKKDSAEYKKFFELASLENKASQLQDLFRVSDEKVIEKLPSLFEKLAQGGLTEEKMNRILAAADL